MDTSRCVIHGPRGLTPLLHGYIESAGRRHLNAVLEDDTGHYRVVVSLTKLPKRLRRGRLEDRYFYMTKRGKLHLCECRYTKADDEEALRLSDELFKWVQPMAETSQLAAERLAALAEKGREAFGQDNPGHGLFPFNCIDLEKNAVQLQTYQKQCGSAGNSLPAE